MNRTRIHATTEGAALGGVIAYLRSRRIPPMPQQELASAVGGMSASAWSRIEKGETELTALQLAKAAAALGTDVNTILRLTNDMIAKLRESGIEVEAQTLKW